MSDALKPVGLTLASLMAAIPVPADVVKDADAMMAARKAQADALADGASTFDAAEPLAVAPPQQGNLFDL